MTNNSKEKVRQLQNKLYLTAKKCSSRRFHALYDKVYRDDVLYEAWKRVKANQGSSGVDGITIEDVEAGGVNRYLTGIQSEIKSGTYRPLPVRRVMIPKPDGSQRPLGIPCVKDRIVQMATKIARLLHQLAIQLQSSNQERHTNLPLSHIQRTVQVHCMEVL